MSGKKVPVEQKAGFKVEITDNEKSGFIDATYENQNIEVRVTLSVVAKTDKGQARINDPSLLVKTASVLEALSNRV